MRGPTVRTEAPLLGHESGPARDGMEAGVEEICLETLRNLHCIAEKHPLPGREEPAAGCVRSERRLPLTKGTLPAGPAETGLGADNHLKKDDLGIIL